MGINPIPLAITDVTTALNTGMIDTVYAPPLGALALQWHVNMKFMTALPLTHSTGAILLSSRFFQKLPENLAKILLESVDSAMSELTNTLRKDNADAVKLIEESGLTITPVPAGDDLQQFYRIHSTVAKNLTGELYPKEVLVRSTKYLEDNIKKSYELIKFIG